MKKDDLFSLQIPVPSIKKQKAILEKIRNEETNIEKLNNKIESHKQKINDLINNIWHL